MHHIPANIHVFPASINEQSGQTYFLARMSGEKFLGVSDPAGFERAELVSSDSWLCPLSAANAATLRTRLPWLNPTPLQFTPSFGFGDRLGLATPGHIQAAAGKSIFPIFAQQSVRENRRTGRTPQAVLDDAMWGVFQAGWRKPWGADADHLKSIEDLAPFADAGYTFFTIDPGDDVNDRAAAASGSSLEGFFQALPWDQLNDSPQGLFGRLTGKHLLPGDYRLELDECVLARAAVKYGRAIAHAAEMSRQLADLMDGRPFDLEISLDETEIPTSPQEHYYVAAELHRLGIHFASLAPRFIGRFEKGVDYIGNPDELSASLHWHAAVMRAFGDYRLSLHSGSDKFRIYPILSTVTDINLHVKTAGTSFLEALRVLIIVQPALFREIYTLASERYQQDRATYHVSADLARVPELDHQNIQISLLDHFDVRQMLHVTFGSILDQYKKTIRKILLQHEDLYSQILKQHFEKHLAPFER
jgi:tagaturonate epimerase